ncbi:MAG: hypothetical protein IKF38_02005 [Clostridia bacterium]|nr:hypothetical protein [Clostridia bacterium]
MKKKKVLNPYKVVLYGLPIIVTILSVMIIFVKINNLEVNSTTMVAIVFFLYMLGLLFLVIAYIQYGKSVKQQRDEALQQAQKKLTSEFQTVFLRNSSEISEKKFECTARIDENGKIICRIQTDIYWEPNDYEQFLRVFSFSQEDKTKNN